MPAFFERFASMFPDGSARFARGKWILAAIALWMAFAVLPVCEAARCEAEKIRARKAVESIGLEWSIRGNDPITQYFSEIARRLVTSYGSGGEAWHVFVVRNLSSNGFSVGNGYLYINEGALIEGQNESEFAAVIAHEIGHQVAGHYCASPEDSGPGSIFNPFAKDRDDAVFKIEIGSITMKIDLGREIEADRYAVDILRRADFNPHALLAVAKRFPNSNKTVTTRNKLRIEALKAALREVPRPGSRSSKRFFAIKTRLQEEIR